jgi:hypothetical protein
MKQLAFVLLLASTAVASADPPIASSAQPARPPPEPAPVPQAPEPTSRDASGAPLPGNESGRTDAEPGDSTGTQVARAALFVPKWLFAIVMAPVEGALYVEGKYQLEDWYDRLFYYRDRTIAIIPTATYATGYGLSVGAQFTDTNTIGRHERLLLEATTGFQYRIGLRASMDTGDRLGPLRLELSGNFDRRPSEPFYGIGNEGDVQEFGTQSMIDAFDDQTAIQSFFRYEEARASLLADVKLWRHLDLDARGSLTELKYTHGTHQFPSIDDVYEPSSLVGFNTTFKHEYGEVALEWDDRAADNVWEPSNVHGTGTLAVIYAGLVNPVDQGTNDFWHYGTELQHYFRIGFGPRVLVARFHGEAVSGNISDIPITELPMLGGPTFLRGYTYARFRDRIAMSGSLQYMWSLTANSHAYLFTDVGRVYREWDDVTLRDLHAGFGLGLEIYIAPTFLTDLSIGSSTDGGVALQAEFSPILDQRTRWR